MTRGSIQFDRTVWVRVRPRQRRVTVLDDDLDVAASVAVQPHPEVAGRIRMVLSAGPEQDPPELGEAVVDEVVGAEDLVTGRIVSDEVPPVQRVGAAAFARTLVALSVGLLDATHYVTAEPPLPAYARRYG